MVFLFSRRLLVSNWDIKKALLQFVDDLGKNKMRSDSFIFSDNTSDILSTDEELD